MHARRSRSRRPPRLESQPTEAVSLLCSQRGLARKQLRRVSAALSPFSRAFAQIRITRRGRRHDGGHRPRGPERGVAGAERPTARPLRGRSAGVKRPRVFLSKASTGGSRDVTRPLRGRYETVTRPLRYRYDTVTIPSHSSRAARLTSALSRAQPNIQRPHDGDDRYILRARQVRPPHVPALAGVVPRSDGLLDAHMGHAGV